MIYVPHRAESNAKLIRINKDLEIQIKKLGVPAELFFIQSHTIPTKIASCYSTVINNLSLLFDFEDIFTFYPPLDEIPKSLLKDIQNIYRDFDRKDIKIIDLYSQENYLNKF